jgi:alkaline phosphatase
MLQRKTRVFIIVFLFFMFFFLSSRHSVPTQAADRPKNIIVMIADGCGFRQVEAADDYEFGEPGTQVYERFPVRLAVSTYSLGTGGYDPDSAWIDFNYVKRKPTDSAAAATALATGVKTLNGRLGLDARGVPVENIVERCEKLGKATGVLTSVPFPHATPAGFVVHDIDRNKMSEIARFMVTKSALEVVMGCGHPGYDESGLPANSSNYGSVWDKSIGGDSVWAALKNGTAGADADGDGKPDPWTLVEDRGAFQSLSAGVPPKRAKRVFGLAETRTTLQEKRKGNAKAQPFAVPFVVTVPTLAEMTSAALNILGRDPDGFFLMAEGGAVDWASHDRLTGRMIEEMADFNRAAEVVVGWIEKNGGWDDNLLIVTADHETGYPTSPKADSLWCVLPSAERGRALSLMNHGKGQVPGLFWRTKGHTNALVPLFAKGAGSERLEEKAVMTDPVLGRYLYNTDIGKVLFELNPLPKTQSQTQNSGRK